VGFEDVEGCPLMAVLAYDYEAVTGGVYVALRERLEERCVRRPETLHGGFFRCPDHRRLDAMRAGEPVDSGVCAAQVVAGCRRRAGRRPR
jgi:hypothetical protein